MTHAAPDGRRVPNRLPALGPVVQIWVMHAFTRRALQTTVATLGLWALAACERSREAPPVDTAAPPSPAPPAPPDSAAPTVGWDPGAGTALFVAGTTPREVVVVFPEFNDTTLTDTTTFDLGSVQSVPVELFSRTGVVGWAQLRSAAPPARSAAECTAWPTARVAGVGGAASADSAPPAAVSTASPPAAPWTVAFVAGHATAIPLDSIEDDAPADSARLAAEVTRLAGTLPDATPAFKGIPFSVRTARRFSPAPGVDAVVGQLVRKVNQEANPREEQTVVIGERLTGTRRAPYVVAYHERVEGLEETIETSDVLAAVRLGPAATPTLVIGRDYGDGTAYALVERIGPAKWRLRWSSAYTGC